MIRILPQGPQGPVQQAVSGPTQRVEPMRDQTGQQIQQVGQGVQSFATGLTRLAATLEEDRLVAVSADFRNRLDDVVTKQLYGPSGFLSRVGKDANPYERAKVMAGIRAEGVKLLGGMENDAQRANLNAAMDQAMVEADGATLRHLATQTLRYKASSLEVSANRSLDKWVRGIGTEDGDIARKAMDDDVDMLGKTLGWDAGMVAAKKLELSSQGHRTIVEGLVSIHGGAKAAKGYIEQHHTEIDGETQGRLGRIVALAEVSELSLSAVSGAMAELEQHMADRDQAEQTPDGPITVPVAGAKLNLREQENWVLDKVTKQNLPAKARDEAVERVRSQFKQLREDEAAQNNELFEEAQKLLLSAGAGASPADLPAPLRDKLIERGVMGKLNAFQNSSERASSDPDKLVEAESMSDQQLASLGAQEFRDRFGGWLAPDQMAKLTARRRVARGEQDKQGREAYAVKQSARVKRAARAVGIIPPLVQATTPGGTNEPALSPEQAAALEDFEFGFDALLRQASGGKPVGPSEEQALLDAYVLQKREEREEEVYGVMQDVGTFGGIVESVVKRKASEVAQRNWWSGGPKPESLFVEIDGKRENLNQIPANIRSEIASGIRMAGRPATEKEIMRQWIKQGRVK